MEFTVELLLNFFNDRHYLNDSCSEFWDQSYTLFSSVGFLCDRRKCVESKNCRILQLGPSAPSVRAAGEVQGRAPGAALYLSPEQGGASQGCAGILHLGRPSRC